MVVNGCGCRGVASHSTSRCDPLLETYASDNNRSSSTDNGSIDGNPCRARMALIRLCFSSKSIFNDSGSNSCTFWQCKYRPYSNTACRTVVNTSSVVQVPVGG